MVLSVVYLFIGAVVQNTFVTAGIRWLSVTPSVGGIVVSTAAVQAIWWFNIQAIKRTDAWEDAAAWIAGQVIGALIGFYLTGGRAKARADK